MDELKSKVAKHEERLEDHEKRLKNAENDMGNLKVDLREGLARVDQSNTYLREQNNQILKEILNQNKATAQQDYDLKKITKVNQMKMFGMIFGASGLAALVLDIILKLLRP